MDGFWLNAYARLKRIWIIVFTTEAMDIGKPHVYPDQAWGSLSLEERAALRDPSCHVGYLINYGNWHFSPLWKGDVMSNQHIATRPDWVCLPDEAITEVDLQRHLNTLHEHHVSLHPTLSPNFSEKIQNIPLESFAGNLERLCVGQIFQLRQLYIKWKSNFCTNRDIFWKKSYPYFCDLGPGANYGGIDNQVTSGVESYIYEKCRNEGSGNSREIRHEIICGLINEFAKGTFHWDKFNEHPYMGDVNKFLGCDNYRRGLLGKLHTDTRQTCHDVTSSIQHFDGLLQHHKQTLPAVVLNLPENPNLVRSPQYQEVQHHVDHQLAPLPPDQYMPDPFGIVEPFSMNGRTIEQCMNELQSRREKALNIKLGCKRTGQDMTRFQAQPSDHILPPAFPTVGNMSEKYLEEQIDIANQYPNLCKIRTKSICMMLTKDKTRLNAAGFYYNRGRLLYKTKLETSWVDDGAYQAREQAHNIQAFHEQKSPDSNQQGGSHPSSSRKEQSSRQNPKQTLHHSPSDTIFVACFPDADNFMSPSSPTHSSPQHNVTTSAEGHRRQSSRVKARHSNCISRPSNSKGGIRKSPRNHHSKKSPRTSPQSGPIEKTVETQFSQLNHFGGKVSRSFNSKYSKCTCYILL